ncbi:MAG TPA: DMT family transporter [Methanocella sp.]|uniref:DMT family transporter n=1 Tax=Methanocella sp. TaxID=2052833 RepID=UPI002B50F39E|nr:DMT family transporter [Methanocella sp.]HTY89643.1 DMT family transporter [Methanocella sp.]
MRLTEDGKTRLTLVLVMALWGGSFIASKVGLEGLFPVELATLRFAIAVPLLVVITLIVEGPKAFNIARKDLPVLIVMALTGVTLQYIVQFYAMTYTSVTNTALLINMGTFFVIIPSAIFLKERLSIDNILGIIIAFIGVALVATKGNFAFSMNLIGDGLVLICAVMWAIYILVGNKLAGKYSVLSQLNYIFIFGFIGLLPFYFITPHHAIGEFSSTTWACLLYLAIICSVIAYFFFNDAIIKLGPAKAALYQYLEPLFAIVLAITLLHEPLTAAIVAGAVFIIAGIAMADNNLKVLGYFIKGTETVKEEHGP